MLYTRKLDHPRVGVKVKRSGRENYVIVPGEDSVMLVRAGTLIKELESDERILSEDGEPVNATGRFFLSCETIDPFHVAFDIF